MFPSGIFVVEHDLHSNIPSKKVVNKTNPKVGSSTPKDNHIMTAASPASSGVKDNRATPTTDGNKVTVATDFSSVPKPDSIAQPPNSDGVDAGQGPKPEPVARPPTIPLSFNLIWATMMAPGNPSI